jgi:hypothetical protein
MKRLSSAIAVGLVLAAATPLRAQDESTPEERAVIKPGEVGRMDPGSVRPAGPVTRFEAIIVWEEAGGPRPTGQVSRKVRYVADCKAGTLTLAAVGILDAEGKLIKTMFVPPGAADSVAPQPGSTEARWLREACSR